MNIFARTLVGALALASLVGLTACGQNNSAQSYQSSAYINGSTSCPVPASELQATLSGAYGVDGRGYPVNAHGFPIDTNGNCISDAPVAEVWPVGNGVVLAPAYNSYYVHRWGVWYAPAPMHIFTPGIVVRVGRPSGYVTRIQTYTAPAPTTTVSVPVGGARSFTPGAAQAVPQGPARNITPGAVSVGAAPVPVAPSAGPAIKPPAPAVAAPAPVSVAPKAAVGGSNTSITRSAPTPSYVAPRAVSAPRSSVIVRRK